jgi:hypothetical protein
MNKSISNSHDHSTLLCNFRGSFQFKPTLNKAFSIDMIRNFPIQLAAFILGFYKCRRLFQKTRLENYLLNASFLVDWMQAVEEFISGAV